ncbi:MAG: hypothetical protein KBA26_06755 [Candidatus Delongbacteria bacterium]|nr:hypothetical protein [Candidatus Delongbacteria bacterium]
MNTQRLTMMMRMAFILVMTASWMWAAGPDKQADTRYLFKTAGKADRKYNVHDGNKILTVFFNFGGIGEWQGVSRIRSGIYPKGSGHSYMAEFSPMVGSEVVDRKGSTIHIFSDGLVSTAQMDYLAGYDPWRFEPLPGYANPSQDKIAMSDEKATWPSSWPNYDMKWDGFWCGQYGKYNRADQESYWAMNDDANTEFDFYPSELDSTKRGLGLEVTVRGYQWANPAAEDILIWTYLITNKGTINYDKMVFGMYGDADIGDDGDQKDDDAAWDTLFNMVFQWDHDAKGVWGGKPAYFGYKFLESPGNSTDGIDNDNDGRTDESQYNGEDDDQDWNAETDDVGADGLGPNDADYPGPDQGEGDGLATLGEPNFEITDNDESDQIGLTSFRADVYPEINGKDDELLWTWTAPASMESFLIPKQTVDLTFLYGSGYFPLHAGETRKFAIAMLFGEDQDDIKRNATTMQKIYDADYSFAKAPNKPNVVAVSGDKSVTLYWDKKAESSRDHIYGNDFEGYRIYRSTEPAFLESWVITDAWGNKTFNKPVAQFDKIDGLKGPHPVAFNGVQFDMGTDNGLAYSWTDTDVENGQVYYYAVCSYDQGYYDDFYDLGISPTPFLPKIAPTECSKIIEVDATGEVLGTDANTVMVTPNAPAAGYVRPDDYSTSAQTVTHTAGIGTGSLYVRILDPLKLQSNWTYSIMFDSLNGQLNYSLKNEQAVTQSVKMDTSWVNLSHVGIDSVGFKVDNDNYTLNQDYLMNWQEGKIKLTSGSRMQIGQSYNVNYHYFPVFQSKSMSEEADNAFFEGMQLLVYNEPKVLWDTAGSSWIGTCNYVADVDEYVSNRAYPNDYEIQFKGSIGDSVSHDQKKDDPSATDISAPFIVMNTTLNEEVQYIIKDADKDKKWTAGEDIIVLRPKDAAGTLTPSKRSVWTIKLDPPEDSLKIDTTITGLTGADSLKFDTTRYPIAVHPKAGDTWRFKTIKPFTDQDEFRFTTTVPTIDQAKAKSELDRISVVPNPYVITASWEPQHFFASGRGERKIDFIHLPNKCTIKIFTIRGYLVDTIEHDSSLDDGSASWDLLSKDNLEIAYGVYIYHVSAPGIGNKIGKFAIIK